MMEPFSMIGCANSPKFCVFTPLGRSSRWRRTALGAGTGGVEDVDAVVVRVDVDVDQLATGAHEQFVHVQGAGAHHVGRHGDFPGDPADVDPQRRWRVELADHAAYCGAALRCPDTGERSFGPRPADVGGVLQDEQVGAVPHPAARACRRRRSTSPPGPATLSARCPAGRRGTSRPCSSRRRSATPLPRTGSG